MGAAEDRTEDERSVSVSEDRFERLLRALERLVLIEERKLAKVDDVKRRAAKALGQPPPPAEALEYVRRKRKQWKAGP